MEGSPNISGESAPLQDTNDKIILPAEFPRPFGFFTPNPQYWLDVRIT